jgi:predicted flavoprotein YhiN
MMAAIAAAGAGQGPSSPRVILLDQLDRPGAKLLVTGGGRCNLTNTLRPEAFMAHFGRQGRFMAPALEAMDSHGLREFLGSVGVPTRVREGRSVYPTSESARDVLGAMRERLKALGVEERYGVCVTGLWLGAVPGKPEIGAGTGAPKRGRSGSRRVSSPGAPPRRLLLGVETAMGRIGAACVILATGGRSYPELGATGTGYEMARQAGHTVVEPTPGLVPLVTRQTWPGELAGVSLPQARVWIDLPKCSKAGVTGPVLFTHAGLSGPAVLDLSGDVAAILARRESVPIRLDFAPGTSAHAWLARFDAWQASGGAKMIGELLADHVPRSVAKLLCELAGVRPSDRPTYVSRELRRALAATLAGASLEVTGTEGFGKAMVTRGGVSLQEIDPHTLESKRLPGLRFAGEILDLDGPCGGFNLQWAFSSGYLAGASART